MANHITPSTKYTLIFDAIFFYLLLLTGFFFLIEVSFFIECNRAYFSMFNFVTDHLRIPTTIVPGIIFFITAQLALHLAYCCLIWLVARLIARLFHFHPETRFWLSIVIWLIGIMTVLTANQHYFPNSKFSALTGLILFQPAYAKTVCYSLLLLSASIGLMALYSAGQWLWQRKRLFFATSILLLLVTASQFKPVPPHQTNAATAAQPNIIIVGVDSLRPDYTGFFGRDIHTPFMDSFLTQSTVFAEAVTPAARTSPSWTGILTGQYPRHIGIRSNLARLDKADFSQALPAILRRHGYETLYATDETRFNNIDTNYGFDQVVTPPMGLNDFLLGSFNDFPLSNLVVNTSLGRWLFPYSYANRPAYVTYEPSSFLQRVRSVLQQPRTRPLFLAIHFCLPHAPYVWADIAGDQLTVSERYQASIEAVDKQMQGFFADLAQANLLQQAIVVLLSDHGETLEFAGDRITEENLFLSAGKKPPRFYPPSLDQEAVNQSAGHGTDVLGLPQYHSLLAFKLYGAGQRVATTSGVVTLLEIKPTLLDLLHLQPSSSDSLAAVIAGTQRTIPLRHIFLESDFSPESIHTIYPETRQVVLDGIEIFQIDPITTRLTVKDSMNAMIIRSKQFADIYGEWMLAVYPQNQTQQMPILINLRTGQWTNDLQSTFAHHSPAVQMLAALKGFYGSELLSAVVAMPGKARRKQSSIYPGSV